jgi:hypothetical protein
MKYVRLAITTLLICGSCELASGQQCSAGMSDQIPDTEYSALVDLYNSTGGGSGHIRMGG